MTDDLTTSESLIFDGSVSLTMAIGLGLLLAAVAGWLLYRERQSLGLTWAGLFWLLRMTAVGIALWMLTGPMHETIERTTTTQSIAILADASESMQIIDASDATEMLRWQLASQHDDQSEPLTHCDRIKVALRVASQARESVSLMVAEHRPIKQIKHALGEAKIAIKRAQDHCEVLIEKTDDSGDDFAERVSRLQSLLDDPIATTLSQLSSMLEDRSTSLVTEMTDALDLLAEELDNSVRRIDSVTKQLANDYPDNATLETADNQELTRREKSLQVLDALQASVLEGMNENVRIRKFQFDSTLMPIAAERSWAEAANAVQLVDEVDHKSQTDLTAVLKQLASDRTSQSTRLAIVVTDGNHTALSEEAPQEIATQITDLPVYAVAVGNSTLVRDLKLHRVEAPSKVVEKDSAAIEAIVTAVDCDGLATEVVLRQNGSEIDRKTVQFTGERVDRRVQFSVSADQLGWQDYELTIEPLEDEESVANNVAPVSWEVVRDKFRVLLADGVSHWEFRYLQQLFRRDSHIECDELLFFPRLRGTGEMRDNPRLPERVEDWSVYDVVILGDLSSQQFSRTSQQALAEYVRDRHGHLILLAGRDHMPGAYRNEPLMDLLPVDAASYQDEDEGYTLMLTDEGRLHSALAIEGSNQASEAAWLSVYRKKPIFKLSEYSRPKPTARTLLRAVPTRMSVVVDDKSTQENLPAFLCWHQVGSGRVVYLAAAEIWKLRYRASDRRHHRFWGQLIRWVTAENVGAGTDILRLNTDKNRYLPQEPIEVTVWLKDQTGRPLGDQQLQVSADTLEASVESTELVSDPNVAGRYFATLEGLASGAYKIVVSGSVLDELIASNEEIADVHAMITVDDADNLEMVDTRCNRTLLEQVAKLTGGQVVPPTAIAEVLQLASLSPEVDENIQRTPLWNRWMNLWLVLGCLVVEWIVRKRKGLV